MPRQIPIAGFECRHGALTRSGGRIIASGRRARCRNGCLVLAKSAVVVVVVSSGALLNGLELVRKLKVQDQAYDQ